jgi:type VI secretion system secreted protein Hcp
MKSKNLGRLTGLALLLACGSMLTRPAPVWAKSNAFMKLPGVVGESTDQDHKDWIIIESFSWGVGKTGAARGHGDLTITKMVDSASPKLMEGLTKGSNFSDVTIEIKRTDGQPGYMSYMLKNIKIVSRTVSPDGRTEKLVFSYQASQVSRG